MQWQSQNQTKKNGKWGQVLRPLRANKSETRTGAAAFARAPVDWSLTTVAAPRSHESIGLTPQLALIQANTGRRLNRLRDAAAGRQLTEELIAQQCNLVLICLSSERALLR